MHRKLILVILLVLPYSWADDGDTTKANALLMKGGSNALIWPLGPVPMHLSGRFKAFNLQKGDDSLVFEADFLDKRHWRTKYEMTGFQKIFVRDDSQTADRQNTDFSPIRIRQIQRYMMPFGGYFERADVIKKIYSKELDGRTAQCIDFQTIKGQQREYPMQKMCISQNPELILLRSDGRFETSWSQFEQFHGKYYPRHVLVKDNGEKILEGDVSVTDAPQLKPALFVIPPGFDVRKACEVRVPPVLIKGDEPQMPSRSALVGTESVVAQLKLGADGKVQKAALIEIADPAVDAAVKKIIPTLQFEPAKCDGEPVPADYDYQVTFHR
jgi:hypothetical protein